MSVWTLRWHSQKPKIAAPFILSLVMSLVLYSRQEIYSLTNRQNFFLQHSKRKERQIIQWHCICNLVNFEKKVTHERRRVLRRVDKFPRNEFLDLTNGQFYEEGKPPAPHYELHIQNCLFSECLYADDTILVGEGNTLNSQPLVVTKTAECIDACINTWGCNYWTVEKSDEDRDLKCDLKSWRGRIVKEPGYISGSLPSACCKWIFRYSGVNTLG